MQQPARNISSTPPRLSTTSSTSSASYPRRGLGAIPISSNSSFSGASNQATSQARSSLSSQSQARSSLSMTQPIAPQTQSNPPFMAQSNTSLFQTPSPPTFQSTSTPNYNISLQATPIVPVAANPVFPTQAPPGMGGVLTPSKPAQPSWATTSGPKQLSKDDWGDFDPLS